MKLKSGQVSESRTGIQGKTRQVGLLYAMDKTSDAVVHGAPPKYR